MKNTEAHDVNLKNNFEWMENLSPFFSRLTFSETVAHPWTSFARSYALD